MNRNPRPDFVVVFHFLGESHRTPVRAFRVSPLPRFNGELAVGIPFVEPRKRKWRSYSVISRSKHFYTIEQDGAVIYDSRQDVPYDPTAWNNWVAANIAARSTA
jgi:hypothetical protein